MALPRVEFRGVTLNERTRDMILAATKLVNFRLYLTQGSYNKGGVSQSAGTHDGGGAVDVAAADLTPLQRGQLVLALRKVGFAAWLRTPSQGDWGFHVHAIATGDTELSAGAAAQVKAYREGKNGLANGGPDDGPGGYRLMTYEYYQYLLSQGTDKENSVTLEQFEALKKLLGQAIAQAVSDTKIDVKQTEILVKFVQDSGAREAKLIAALDALTLKVDALPKA